MHGKAVTSFLVFGIMSVAIELGSVLVAGAVFDCNQGKDGSHTDRYPKLFTAIAKMLTSEKMFKVATTPTISFKRVQIVKNEQAAADEKEATPEQTGVINSLVKFVTSTPKQLTADEKEVASALHLTCDMWGKAESIKTKVDSKLSTQIDFEVAKEGKEMKPCRAILQLELLAQRFTSDQEEKYSATVKSTTFVPEDCKQLVQTKKMAGMKHSLRLFRQPIEEYYTRELKNAIAESEYYSHPDY